MTREELNDTVWAKMKDHLPGKTTDPGRSGQDNRKFMEAILWLARTGAHWRALPEYFGKWNSVYVRFNRWCRDGVFDRLFNAMADDPDFEYVLVDSTIVRAHQHSAGAQKGGLKLKVEMLRLKTTRIELADDTSEADLRAFQSALHEFSREHQIEAFVIKTRAKKGKMAGGAVSFKIETLIQLVEGCDTRFVSPVALSNFAKKDLEAYPDKLLVYLKNAFLAGSYVLTKG